MLKFPGVRLEAVSLASRQNAVEYTLNRMDRPHMNPFLSKIFTPVWVRAVVYWSMIMG